MAQTEYRLVVKIPGQKKAAIRDLPKDYSRAQAREMKKKVETNLNPLSRAKHGEPIKVTIQHRQISNWTDTR